MKILLIGEYSRLHNSLKEGLEALGHRAVIVSSGDAFKNYTTDYTIAARITARPGFSFIKKVLYRVTKTDLAALERAWAFYRLLPKLKGFDHVQLINSDAIEAPPWLSVRMYKKLLRQNGPMSLLVCGDETPIVDFALSGNLKYSVLTPYLNNKSLKPLFRFSLKYTTSAYRKLFAYVEGAAQNIITSDLDYEVPMQAMGYNTTFIPNPVNADKINYIPLKVTGRVIIFLGINRLSYTKKGINFFEDALEIVKEKYTEKIDIIISENLPYAEYISKYNKAHIVLDQVYAYDQGYNALEAMAKGKVVFTGAESEFTSHYKLEKTVAINALPDANAIAETLGYLIEHPEEMEAISRNARKFIEEEHNYIDIAKRYIDTWTNQK